MATKPKKTTKQQSLPPLKKAGLRPTLVHHRHSFKLLPVQHTSYSVVAYLFLMVVMFTAIWSAFAGATMGGSYVTRAIVPADPLGDAATMDAPDDGQVFTSPDITVTGDCPNNSYVTLLRNNIYAGTAICDNLRWSLQLNLVTGSNVLLAQDYNVTDMAGPTTPSRTVRYNPPVVEPTPETPQAATKDEPAADDTPATPVANAKQPDATAPPLVLTGSFSFQGIQVGQTLSKTFNISGGTKPYALSIDWGDGTTDLVSQADAGDVTVQHVYPGPGTAEHSSYSIKISATDGSGQSALLQTLTIVTALPSVAAATTAGGTGGQAGGVTGAVINKLSGGSSALKTFWHVAGPTYGVSTVALSSFWLGQHRQLELLRRQAVRLHKRRPI